MKIYVMKEVCVAWCCAISSGDKIPQMQKFSETAIKVHKFRWKGKKNILHVSTPLWKEFLEEWEYRKYCMKYKILLHVGFFILWSRYSLNGVLKYFGIKGENEIGLDVITFKLIWNAI